MMQQQQRKMLSEEQRQIHEEKIKSAKTRNEKILELRRQDYFSKKAQAEERKRELDEIGEIERKQKIQFEKEKQEYREQV